MSNTQPLYIEASDEITTVVERLQEHDETTVLLVAPKGAALLQSIVNLKLIKKAAKDAGKHVILVTTDKIGRNLALQVGIDHATKVEEAEKAIPEEELQEEAHVISGVRIHRYYEDKDEEETSEDTASTTPVEPIVPKKLLKEKEVEEDKLESTTDTTPDATPESSASESTQGETTENTAPTVEKILPKQAATKSEIPNEPEITRRSINKESHEPEPAHQPKKKRRTFILVVGLIVSILLISGGTAFLYLPVTTVTAQVPATPWKEQFTLTANPSPDASQITAQSLTATDTQSLTFKATGTKELGEKAHGTATIFNSYSSDPQKLPAGTRLTAKGRVFTTDTDATVPGARVEAGKLVAGSTNVAISAVDAGPESNMENTPATPATGNVIMQVVSTTGGSSRVVAVVSESDITTAKNTLSQNLKQSIAEKLASTMKDQDVISDSNTDVITVDALKSSVKAGDEKDSGEVSGTASIKRTVVKVADIEAGVEKLARAKADAKTVVKINNVKVIQQEINSSTNTATITCDGYGTRSTHVDTTDLPQQLAGKTFKEGTDLIHTLVKDKSTTISYTPPWWPRSAFPSQSRFIQVHIKYE